MRVIQVVQTLVAGGAETMVRTLCAGVAAAGIDVRVVSVYPSGLDDDAREGLGVPVVDLGRRGRGDLGYFPRLLGALRALRPDVVHGHVHTGQYAGRAAAVLAGVPAIVLTVHGREPGGPVRWAVDRVLHARTARFVVFTESQRRRFAAEQHVPPERIAVIPNGVAPRAQLGTRAALRERLGIPSDRFVVYVAGRLSPEKNLRAAIDAMAFVRDAGHADAELIVAGTGPLAGALPEYARDAGVADRVRFLGYRADAAQLFPAMDVFLLPSYGERMPMALGEAMLAGLPPVTSPWEGHDDIVTNGETALVAAGFDAASLAGAIVRAARDRGALARIAAAAAERARTSFDVGTMVRRHVDLYRAIAPERAP